MKGYMYILECSDGSYYTGSTVNLEKRLTQHQNSEGSNHTKKNLPVKLVYHEEYMTIGEAFNREKQVQRWRREKKEALINRTPYLLPELARNYTENFREVPPTGSGTPTSSGTPTGSGTGTMVTELAEVTGRPLRSG